ncbi:restriction endonuclease subunit S [Actibacterium sp. EMB200-NS6]|uniref:restriction endonuclease subunit S n=1 Tax=Actibacterium sp. EMB200-NS6 TaxID=1609966 RepID=UPI0009E866CB|nr:restriction endonuclease subunit S [Actibacterium sp. EMB200-NS6]
MKPEGWEITTVGKTVNIASGQVDPKDEAIADLISVGPDNLLSGGGIEKSSLKSARELGQISGKYAFDRNAILYSKIRPNLNKVALPSFDGICSADMYPMWVSDSARANREFIYFVLTSQGFVSSATSRSFRTGLPKINREDLEAIEFPLPPLPEQRKIARDPANLGRRAQKARHPPRSEEQALGCPSLCDALRRVAPWRPAPKLGADTPCRCHP